MDTNYLYPKDSGFWIRDEINALLLWAKDLNASDVKIKPNTPIWIRQDGRWTQVTQRPVKSDEIFQLMDAFTRDEGCSAKVKSGVPRDFGYEIRTEERGKKQGFRCNATACKDGWSTGAEITMRINPSMPPSVEDINLEPELVEMASPDNGLVLFSGVMGSGKTTSLAAILRNRIETEPKSVSTYEDPIEFDLTQIPNPMGPVTQAEIPRHLTAFGESSRNAARRATDIILYGEARDLITMQGMMESAELGVAAYATVHTRSVPETPSRIINKFPNDVQNQIAATCSAVLRLIVQQRLLPKVGGGRVPIKEILCFDQSMRLELSKTPIDKYIPTIDAMLHEYGQPLLLDAERKFEDGLIHEKDFLTIKKEKERAHVA